MISFLLKNLDMVPFRAGAKDGYANPSPSLAWEPAKPDDACSMESLFSSWGARSSLKPYRLSLCCLVAPLNYSLTD